MNSELFLEPRCFDQFPACMTTEHVARALGLAPHNIAVLVQAGLLKPLGHPPSPNCVKYFCKTALAAKCNDEQWLGKVVDAVARHWQKKNAAKTKCRERATSTSRDGSNPVRGLE